MNKINSNEPSLKLIKAIHADDFGAFIANIERCSKVTLTPEFLGSLLHEVNIPWVVYSMDRYPVSTRIASYLVSHGADVNFKDKFGNTILCSILQHNTVTSYYESLQNFETFSEQAWEHYQTAYRSCVELVEIILQAKPNLNLSCDGGEDNWINNPLSLCVYFNNFEILKLFLQSPSIRFDTEILLQAYEIAVLKNNTHILNLLLSTTASKELVEYALETARLKNSIEALTVLNNFKHHK